LTRQSIIEKTVNAINQLPPDKAVEISDFAEFLIRKYDEHILTKGIEKLVSEGHTFDFLREDEVEYSVEDLKVIFDGKG
jgi:uncharacterized membrane-anchored protein YjiN (DUF445 family)